MHDFPKISVQAKTESLEIFKSIKTWLDWEKTLECWYSVNIPSIPSLRALPKISQELANVKANPNDFTFPSLLQRWETWDRIFRIAALLLSQYTTNWTWCWLGGYNVDILPSYLSIQGTKIKTGKSGMIKAFIKKI